MRCHGEKACPSGDAYTFRDLAEMHQQAGYGEVTAHPEPMSPNTIVKAHA